MSQQFSAKILADSLSPKGVRLTTFQVTFPRIILAEVNTHRMLSRNFASSRAIPHKRMVESIEANPFVPEFARNQKGMQAADALESEQQTEAEKAWKQALQQMIDTSETLSTKFGVHKQWTNRLLEPWMWANRHYLGY